MAVDTLSPPRPVTAEELFLMPDDDRPVELVDGELVWTTPTGYKHGHLVGLVYGALQDHVRSIGAGEVLAGEPGFVLRRSPDTVRAPDVAYIDASMIPGPDDELRFIEGAPDLAVEILSPTQSRASVDDKAQEYIAAGCRLAWVIYPQSRTASVWRADGTTEHFPPDGSLRGEDVLPGFELRLADLFE